MAIEAELADGRILEFPDGTDPKVIQNTVKKMMAPPEPTFMGRAKTALGQGLEQIPESLAGIGLGIKSGLGFEEAAAKQRKEIQQEATKPREAAPPITWEELENTYGKEGAIEALKKMPSYLAEQILQSAPSMAVPLVAAGGAAALSGPFAPIVSPVVGIGTYGLQQFGNFMQRQAQGNLPLEPGKAAAVAAATAPLGYFADRLTLGLGAIPEKILGKEVAAELAKRTAGIGGRAAVGATTGVVAEAPIEVLEQIAERWQAGLPLKTEDAIKEYKEAFFGAAAVGGVAGAGSRILAGSPAPQTPPAITPTPEAAQPEQPIPQAPTGGLSAERAAELRAEADAEAAAKAPKLALEMSQPFTPVGLPDGSVALTQADYDEYQREARRSNGALPILKESPLPGIPKISASGNVALTPEQELQAQYAPQPVRMTQEVWNSMSPEERDAASVKAHLDEQARIEAAQADISGKKTKEKDIWSEAELEAMKKKGKERKAGPAIKATEHPENIGVIGTDDNGLPIPGLLSEGAKPFVSKDVADYVRKNQPMMKSVQLQDGSYVLSPKTEAELAREDKSKIHVATSGAKGEPIDASAFIAGAGGLNFKTQPDVYPDENPKIGNRNLFQKNGVDLDRAGEMLQQAGYFDNLPEGESYTENDVIRAITGKKYRPEDEAFLAEKQTKEREQAEIYKENKASTEAQMAEDMGYPNTPKGIANSFLERATDQGIDVESIQEQAARETHGQSEDAYHDRVSALAREALNNTSTLYSVNKESKPKKATAAELKMQKDLEGKTMVQAAQYLVANAPNSFQKFVAKKVLNVINEMAARGVDFNFEVQSGNTRNSNLYDAEGLTTHLFNKEGKPLRIQLLLNGAPIFEKQRGYPSGLSYKTLMHEMLHVATSTKVWFLADTHPAVKELNDLYKTVAEEFKKQRENGTLPDFLNDFYNRKNNALENPNEMLTWSMTDERMQKWMSDIKVGDKTVFSKIIDLIRQVLGISKPFETALDRLVRTTDSLLDMDTQILQDGMIAKGHTFGPKQPVKKMPTQQQTLFSKRAQALFGEEKTEKLQFGKKAEPTPTANGQASLDNLAAMGKVVAEPEDGYITKMRNILKDARDNPATTAETARNTFQRWRDRAETWAFSSDAALNNAIQREIINSELGQEEKIGLLLNTSLSQTVHSDAVASLFLRKGGIKYNDELHKWEGVDKDSNFIKLSQQLDALAEKNGLTKEQAELIGHTAFEAKRYRSMVKFNDELAEKIRSIRAEAASKRVNSPVAASALNEKASRMQSQFKYLSDQQAAMIEPGMKLFEMHPELNDVVKTWNEIRANAVEAMVSTGFWSEQQAQEMLSNADYVPFYREEEIGETKNYGPQEFIRGLQVQKDKRLKGSDRPVADIFDNQVKWVQYSINRAVRNRSAVALADTAVSVGAARQVDERKGNDNVVSVWKNIPKLDKEGKAVLDKDGKPVIENKEVFYSMDDPMFVEAFTGLEAIVIPSWKWASNLANMLRQSVVMYPLFSVAQVPQDSFAAIFSSGLKPQYALRIPILAVKEFIQTIRGKSSTHEELKNVGAVGVRDFTSAMVRMDAEIYAGLKAPPGFLGKLKYGLNHIAMAADNAVRQAVFEAAEAQGLSKAEAFEKAFEVFNVRRKGSSKTLALASQLIPFFNAYLAAQNVAYKTITGRGISPEDRSNALQTLAATTASVMTLSLLYAMLNGDDDDYLKKPAVQRDRLLMIPGTGGMSIPLRSDFFTLPKIITEHMYLLMTDKGYEDGRKFRESMTNALANSLLSPTAVPQAIKPIIEVAWNRDFFQGRPLIGTYQQKLETERQFTDSTSELGKFIGSSGLISPIAVDHLIRGMLGSAGGLTLYMTSAMLDNNPESPRPSLSLQDAIATLPGMSGFVAKTYENSLKRDFYSLKEEVDKSVNTFNDIKKRSPEEIPAFLKQEENIHRLGLQKTVNKVAENLSKIRDSISRITNSNLPAEEKQKQIAAMRQVENDVLKGVNVKQLREYGMI